MGLTTPIRDGNKKNKTNCVPATRDGNWNTKKAFPQFETGTGITKELSRYLGRERET